MLYAIVLAVTFGINIPLNDELDRAGDPDRIADLADVRNRFEGPWVAANVVRTLLLDRGGRRSRPRPVPARSRHGRGRPPISILRANPIEHTHSHQRRIR